MVAPFLTLFCVLGALGIGATIYALVPQRLAAPVPAAGTGSPPCRAARGARPGPGRAALAALGPDAAQARQLTEALAGRRVQLARLVHNLAVVARAAATDGQLKTVVSAGNQTLAALVAEERPLRRGLRGLPSTLDATGR